MKKSLISPAVKTNPDAKQPIPALPTSPAVTEPKAKAATAPPSKASLKPPPKIQRVGMEKPKAKVKGTIPKAKVGRNEELQRIPNQRAKLHASFSHRGLVTGVTHVHFFMT